jgi:hypothetical protein
VKKIGNRITPKKDTVERKKWNDDKRHRRKRGVREGIISLGRLLQSHSADGVTYGWRKEGYKAASRSSIRILRQRSSSAREEISLGKPDYANRQQDKLPKAHSESERR